jgi:hypothetical protein
MMPHQRASGIVLQTGDGLNRTAHICMAYTMLHMVYWLGATTTARWCIQALNPDWLLNALASRTEVLVHPPIPKKTAPASSCSC